MGKDIQQGTGMIKSQPKKVKKKTKKLSVVKMQVAVNAAIRRTC